MGLGGTLLIWKRDLDSSVGGGLNSTWLRPLKKNACLRRNFLMTKTTSAGHERFIPFVDQFIIPDCVQNGEIPDRERNLKNPP